MRRSFADIWESTYWDGVLQLEASEKKLERMLLDDTNVTKQDIFNQISEIVLQISIKRKDLEKNFLESESSSKVLELDKCLYISECLFDKTKEYDKSLKMIEKDDEGNLIRFSNEDFTYVELVNELYNNKIILAKIYSKVQKELKELVAPIMDMGNRELI
ncbi:hypothetical protein [Vagococcus fluvialis]|uniref:Uncharacterized protein n=1 Tax=Vagococcus fluvialis TaxID=2738 RepID=A0A7X6DA11_9ENTE|nr:hypothetical protein [Vagococcus fluvialis]NKC68564.1 hypothetical protein [Vagococcus fluvialis]